LDSRKARREPGIMPLMPPPSMLSTVATLLLTKPAISVSNFNFQERWVLNLTKKQY